MFQTSQSGCCCSCCPGVEVYLATSPFDQATFKKKKQETKNIKHARLLYVPEMSSRCSDGETIVPVVNTFLPETLLWSVSNVASRCSCSSIWISFIYVLFYKS